MALRPILPGAALSLIFSNFYYNSLLTYQQRQREQRLGYHCLALWDQHFSLNACIFWLMLLVRLGAMKIFTIKH